MQEITEAEEDFKKALEPIKKEKVDVAFFPVDPRQGSMFEAGADSFILSIKPRLLIPMHYFHRADVAMEYARTAGNRSTAVLAMPEYGMILKITVDDSGFMDLSFISRDELPIRSKIDSDKTAIDSLSDNNPFNDTDLPLSQLAFSTEEDSMPKNSKEADESLKNKD